MAGRPAAGAAGFGPDRKTSAMSTDDVTDRVARLERQLQDAAARLSALEHAAGAPGSGRALPSLPMSGPGDALGGVPGGVPNAVPESEETAFEYSGRGRFGKHQMVVHRRAGLAEVMGTEPDQLAKVFAALASPARIVLLRSLLDGPLTSQELRARLADPSVGQLYHHLNQLLAAGLVVQPGRSRYALPQGNEIALCVELLTAGHLIEGGQAPWSGAGPEAAENGTAPDVES